MNVLDLNPFPTRRTGGLTSFVAICSGDPSSQLEALYSQLAPFDVKFLFADNTQTRRTFHGARDCRCIAPLRKTSETLVLSVYAVDSIVTH